MSFLTSGDILNTVLSVVVALVGLGLLWLIVELIRIVRPLRKLVETAERRLTRIDDAVGAIRDKLVAVASAVPFVSGLVKGMGGARGKRRR